MKQVTLIIAGAGGRGSSYARHATKSGMGKVIGVADPREFYRERQASDHGIPKENVFTDWKDMAARERFADAVRWALRWVNNPVHHQNLTKLLKVLESSNANSCGLRDE